MIPYNPSTYWVLEARQMVKTSPTYVSGGTKRTWLVTTSQWLENGLRCGPEKPSACRPTGKRGRANLFRRAKGTGARRLPSAAPPSVVCSCAGGAACACQSQRCSPLAPPPVPGRVPPLVSTPEPHPALPSFSGPPLCWARVVHGRGRRWCTNGSAAPRAAHHKSTASQREKGGWDHRVWGPWRQPPHAASRPARVRGNTEDPVHNADELIRTVSAGTLLHLHGSSPARNTKNHPPLPQSPRCVPREPPFLERHRDREVKGVGPESSTSHPPRPAQHNLLRWAPTAHPSKYAVIYTHRTQQTNRRIQAQRGI